MTHMPLTDTVLTLHLSLIDAEKVVMHLSLMDAANCTLARYLSLTDTENDGVSINHMNTVSVSDGCKK